MFMDEQIVEKLRDIQFYKKPSRRRMEEKRLRGGRAAGKMRAPASKQVRHK